MSAPSTAAEFAARFQSELASAERSRVEALGPEASLWLGLAPCWSVPAAEVAGFPAPGGVPAFVDHVVAAGVAERATTLGPEGRDVVTFWAASSARASLVDPQRQLGGEVALADAVRGIAARAIQASSQVELPGPLRRWTDLVVGAEGIPGGRDILRRVAEAVEDGDTVAAAEVLAVGEALEPLVGPTMTSALLRGRRQLNLGFRRRHDARALGHFLRRDEQVSALRELVSSGGDPWALHLLGMGGVGKTMLIRYLSSGQLAADLGMPPFPVARADFDHISPDYPSRRPVQLLLELADELLLFVDTDARERALWDFQSLADSAHAARAGREVEDPEDLVEQAVQAFAQVLNELPQPVVLVLDTCEELAKLHPGAAEVPAVERTFELLVAVHELAPRTRVLLAGRRYLGRRGAGWSVDVAAGARALSSMAERPYLRLHELRGFTADEARTFFSIGGGRPMPEDLLGAVLDRSREVGRVAGDVSAGAEPVARYNPFDLDLYRSWFADDDDPLTVARLDAAGHDAYVSARIVQRLRDSALLQVLPAAALLGRFDQATLAPVCRSHGLEPRDVFDRLAEQEWIDVGADALTGARVLEVEPHLHPRLLAWARAPERSAALERAARALREPLEAALREVPLDQLSTATVAAALGVAAAAERLTRWEVVQERAVAASAWDWLVNVARVVEPLAERWADPLLQATLTAAVASALRHQNPRADVGGLWQAVRRLVDPLASAAAAWRAELTGLALAPPGPGLPDEAAASLAASRAALQSAVEARGTSAGLPAAEALARRADLGLVGAGVVPLGPALERLRQPGGSPAAYLSAVEALLEGHGPSALQPLDLDLRLTLARPGSEEQRVRWVNPWNGLPLTAPPDATPDWLPAAGVALARIAGSRQLDRAAPLLAQAETAARSSDRRPLLDWPGHGDPLVWVLLHRARYEQVIGTDPSTLPLDRWEALGVEHIDEIDGERLVSACLALRLAWGPVPAERLDALAAADRYSPERLPLWAVHDAVPPLFVTLAEGYVALGQDQMGSGILTARLREARGRRFEDSTVRGAEDALVRLRYLHAPTPAVATEVRAATVTPEQLRPGRGADLVAGPTAADVAAAAASVRQARPAGPPRALGIALLTRAQRLPGEASELRRVLLGWAADLLEPIDPPLADRVTFLVRQEEAAALFKGAVVRPYLPPTGVGNAVSKPGELVCGGCGAGNVSTRTFCGRCGVELHHGTVPAPGGAQRSSGRWVRTVAAAGLALLALLAVLASAWLSGADDSATCRGDECAEDGGSLGFLPVVVLVVVAVAGIGAAVLLLRWLVPRLPTPSRLTRRWITDRHVVPVALRAEVAADGGSITLRQDVDEDLVRQMGLAGRALGYAAQGRLAASRPASRLAVTGPTSAPVDKVAVEPVPPALRIDAAKAAASDALYACPLVVPPQQAALDWESALGDALGTDDAWRALWFRTAERRDPIGAEAWAAGGVRPHGPPEWMPLLVQGYDLHREGSGPGQGSGAIAIQDATTARVVHAVGTSVLTASGVRLRLDLPSSTVGRASKGGGAPQTLVAVDELGPLDGVGLLVLQGLPYEGGFFDDEREAQGFRRLATEAAAAGARAVLVVPSLPVEVAGEAPWLVQRHWVQHDRPPGRDRVLFAAGRLKAAVVEHGRKHGDVEAARRAALRVLLILSSWRS